MRRFMSFVGLIIICCLFSLSGVASESHEIMQMVDQIKAVNPSNARAELAMELSKKLGRLPEGASVEPIAIDKVASLLNEKDDAVQRWGAAALGQLGPRATQWIPVLEEALIKAEQAERQTMIIHSTTLSDNIRYALQRIRSGDK